MTTLRDEQPGDEAAIHHIHHTAFTGNEAALVDLLRTRGMNIVSMVALQNDQIIGHVLFTEVTVEPATVFRGVGLAPVAVLPESQNKGFGSALIRAGLARCAQRGYDFAVVLGHMNYYPRFGFQPASVFGLGNTYGAGDEFMALEFHDGVLGTFSGMVHYQPEFDELGV
jgi:putative acetyltransferase